MLSAGRGCGCSSAACYPLLGPRPSAMARRPREGPPARAVRSRSSPWRFSPGKKSVWVYGLSDEVTIMTIFLIDGI